MMCSRKKRMMENACGLEKICEGVCDDLIKMEEEVCGMELINLRDSCSAFYIKFRVSSEPSMLHEKAPKSGVVRLSLVRRRLDEEAP
jgi:hypothetical protein